MNRRTILTAALAALFVGCGREPAGAGPTAAAAAKTPVVVVRRGDISRHVELPAEIHANREVTLYAKLTGHLKSWRKVGPERRDLDIGDEIAAVDGDAGILAELEAPELEADVRRLKAETEKADADLVKAKADEQAAVAAVQEARTGRTSGEALERKSRSALAAAEAEVRRHQSELELAETTFKRYEDLHKSKTVTELEFEQARSRFVSARATLESVKSKTAAVRDEVAYAAARLAELDAKIAGTQAKSAAATAAISAAEAAQRICAGGLEAKQAAAAYRFIRAPFPGVVIRRHVDLGALVPAATANATRASAVLTLADLATVRVVVDVPEVDALFANVGALAVVALPDVPGAAFPGKITRTSQSLSPATRTMRVEIDLVNADRRLRPGMYGRVKLKLETRRNAVVVPAGAVGGRGRDRFVMVVASIAERRPVKVGFTEGDFAELAEAVIKDGKIESGVREGESVIRLDRRQVQPGEKIEVEKTPY